MQVNYEGTLHVIDACLAHGCSKLVYSSSPSTRFDGMRMCVSMYTWDTLSKKKLSRIKERDYCAVAKILLF